MAVRAELLDEGPLPRLRLLKDRERPAAEQTDEAIAWFHRAMRWQRRLDELRAECGSPESDLPI